MNMECPICLERIDIKNLEVGEEITCPACGAKLEIHQYQGEWELWEIEKD